jgi:hypothetical protein
MEFGMMNALRTGNVVLDMIACMLIPVLMGAIGSVFVFLKEPIVGYLRRKFASAEFIRRIEYSSGGDSNVADERNNILQKALLMYIGHVKKEKNLQYLHADYALVAIKEKQEVENHYGGACSMEPGTTSSQLAQYSVQTNPPLDTWVQITPDITFKQSRTKRQAPQEDGGGGRGGPGRGGRWAVPTRGSGRGSGGGEVTTEINFELRCMLPNAQACVDGFIAQSFLWYKEQMMAQEDHARYMYLPSIGDGGGGGGGGSDGGYGGGSPFGQPAPPMGGSSMAFKVRRLPSCYCVACALSSGTNGCA